MSFSATEINPLAVINQVADGITTPSYKWFSLQGNVLDGTYHPMDSSLASQVGWWGTSLSDSSGAIATAPALTYTITASIHTIAVTGDSLLGEYPVDFTMALYNQSTLLYTHTVTANTLVSYSAVLASVYDVTSLVLTITKVNKVGKTVKVLESYTLTDTISRTDNLLPKTIESISSVSTAIYSTDSLLPKAADVSIPVSNTLSSKDTILTNALAASFFTRYEIWSNDVLLAKVVDASSPITALVSSTDSLLTKLSEAKVMTINLFRTDSLLPAGNIEVDNVLADIFSADIVSVLLNEVSLITNVHTQMDAPMRQTFARVTITYSSPFLDANITVTASNTAYSTSPQQTADSITNTPYKWLQLGQNVLDGTFHPLSGSVGWWDTTLSTAGGLVSPPAVLTVTFDARPVYSLLVTGDTLLNVYPVDFTVKLYDVSGTLLLTQTVTGNTLVSYTANIAYTPNVCSMVLSVTKINVVGTTCKIVEFYTAVQETYEGDQILSVRLLEEQVYDNQSLPIGNVSSNEVDIRLSNQNGYFDPGNVNSPIRALMKRNRKVQLWFGTMIGSDIEWYPMGTFWTLDWKAPRAELFLDITARDKLELMRSTTYNTSPVFTGKSVGYIAEAILVDYGMISSDYSIDASLYSVIIPYAWFDRVSHREAITKLVEASLARCYCDRTGKIIITSFVPPSQQIYTFTEDTSIIDFSNPLVWSQITNYVEVTVSPRVLTSSTTVYQDATGVVLNIPASSTLVQTYTFNTIPCTTILMPTFSAAAGVTITGTTVYAWGIDVTFQNTSNASQPISNVVIAGQPMNIVGNTVVIAKDDINIRDNGKQKYTLNNDFIQSIATAQNISSSILSTYKDPRHDASLETRGNIALRLGDRVSAPDYGNNSFSDYFIVRQTLTWDGGLSGTVDAQRIGSG